MKKALFVALLVLPLTTTAQQKAPIAQYWMSVETAAGMSIPGMAGMGGFMAGMMGAGQQSSGRKIGLQIGSQRNADAPAAAHEIPSGMNMGPSLPLLTPTTRPVEVVRERRDRWESPDRPKGRMLIYWGCGESVRAGQPVVIDFSTVGQGQMPAGFTSRAIATGSPPGGRTTGTWPNQQDSQSIPDAASLRGAHTIRGNYSPDMRFSLGDDFMEQVSLQQTARGAGASVSWNALGNATGYFATVMGGDGNDMVMWSSSEVREMGGTLMDYIPPGEVSRLIREKVVLSPQTTECTVPDEVMKRAGGSAMFNFIAYGPEANFAQPPRPQDPQWAVKVRFKSTASTLLGDAGQSRGSRSASPGRTPASAPDEQGQQAQQEPASPASPVREGINILRGIFGR